MKRLLLWWYAFWIPSTIAWLVYSLVQHRRTWWVHAAALPVWALALTIEIRRLRNDPHRTPRRNLAGTSTFSGASTFGSSGYRTGASPSVITKSADTVVYGWRLNSIVNTLVGGKPQLSALSVDYKYGPEPDEAVHVGWPHGAKHQAPRDRCACGYYLFSSSHILRQAMGLLHLTNDQGQAAITVWRAWGRIVKHTYGYRVQHMRLVGVMAESLGPNHYTWLAQAGWPIYPLDELRHMTGEA